jgi:hypothetical protein
MTRTAQEEANLRLVTEMYHKVLIAMDRPPSTNILRPIMCSIPRWPNRGGGVKGLP